MSRQVEYAADFSTMFLYGMFLNIALIVALGLAYMQTVVEDSGASYFIEVSAAFLVFGNAVYLWLYIAGKASRIVLLRDKSMLEVHYLLGLKTSDIVSTRGMDCSFESEQFGLGRTTAKMKVFRITANGQTLLELVPGVSGWEESVLAEIFDELNSMKKKTAADVSRVTAVRR